MGSFHTRELSFFLSWAFLSETGGSEHVGRDEAAALPRQRAGPRVYSGTPGPGRRAEGWAIYTPKETGGGAERRTQPAARPLTAGWDGPSTFPVPSSRGTGGSPRLAPFGGRAEKGGG